MKTPQAVGTGMVVAAWLAIALVGVPALIVLGLWLLGVPLDWSSWKTYAGIIALTAAMVLASK